MFEPCAYGRTLQQLSGSLYRDVLVRRCVREPRDQAEPRLPDPRSHAIEKGELPYRRKDRPLVNQLLHLVQHRLPLPAVQFDRLLLVERIDVGVAAVNKRTAFDDVGLIAGRGIAKGARAGLDHVLEGLLGVSLDEGGSLDRPQLQADADGLKVVEHRFADICVGRVAKILAGVETLGEAGLGKDLFGLFWVVDWGGRLPEEFVIVGNDRVPGDERMAEGQRLVEAFAVDREAGGAPHSLVVPRRFRIPLVGKIDVEHALDDRRLQGQPGGALQLFSELAADRVGDVDLAALQRGKPCGLVGDHLEDQALYFGRLAPVLIESFKDQLDAGSERDELVGPGADRRLFEPFVADLLDVFPGYDPARP